MAGGSKRWLQGGYSYGEVKISGVMVRRKGRVSGEERRAPNPLGSEGFAVQHRKGGGHFIAKNTVNGVKTFGMVLAEAFIEV